MADSNIITERMVRGFPAHFDTGRTVRQPVETDTALACYVLLRASRAMLRYSDVDVLSGLATQFLYAREHPECVNLTFVPPVETLLKTLGAEWKEIIPSAADAAYEVVRECAGRDLAIFARLKEPVIFYGFAESRMDRYFMLARAAERMERKTVSIIECDRDYWRYPLDEGNTLIYLEHVEPEVPKPTELCHLVAHRAVKCWKAPSLASCAAGEHAYMALAADLRDLAVEYIEPRLRPWMGRALWKQWTARASLHDYFDRMAPRFGGAERGAFAKAAFSYQQCLAAWHKFGNSLGPTWDFTQRGFGETYPPEFLLRWKNAGLRAKAAAAVDEARVWEGKAVNELLRVIA